MAPRQIIFAVLFGVVIAFVMRYALGGELLIHLLVAVPAALAGGWFAMRKRS
jgi:uncharacterized membrane protein